MENKNTYYYVTTQRSNLGKRLVRLDHRCYEVSHAAEKLVVEKNADEWKSDPRYLAGGIWRFIFKNAPKAKKSFMVVARSKDGEYECVPNPMHNCGLELAKKVDKLPHVTYNEVCEAFGFDPNSPEYIEHLIPEFYPVGNEWVYVTSSFDLSTSFPELTPCSKETFDAALRFIQEEESPTLLSEE